ncbi:MAG: M55 family metallopeptidase [Gemmatimonadetes bacterium]|nr:M55 family metallopeptidase [Gemmatimonadota bacterium]
MPGVVGVAVKTGIWDRAVTTMSPDSAQAAIQRGVERALRGTPAHTGSGIVADLRINGVSVGEWGMNAWYAAWYGVPVAFISGDTLAITQLRALVPGVVGVAVKTGIWDRAVTTMSPDSAQAAIQRGVERALRGTRSWSIPRRFTPRWQRESPASGARVIQRWDSAPRTIRRRIG